MSGAVAGCFIVQRFARNGGQYAPGREIEGPMVQVIPGGLITSVALNLLVLPTLHFVSGALPPTATRNRRRLAGAEHKIMNPLRARGNVNY
jgi:hypothetical protein